MLKPTQGRGRGQGRGSIPCSAQALSLLTTCSFISLLMQGVRRMDHHMCAGHRARSSDRKQAAPRQRPPELPPLSCQPAGCALTACAPLLSTLHSGCSRLSLFLRVLSGPPASRSCSYTIHQPLPRRVAEAPGCPSLQGQNPLWQGLDLNNFQKNNTREFSHEMHSTESNNGGELHLTHYRARAMLGMLPFSPVTFAMTEPGRAGTCPYYFIDKETEARKG